MVNYFVEKVGLQTDKESDDQISVSSTLIQHCKQSKSTQISLRDCGLQALPQFPHAANVTYLDLDWNSLQNIDIAGYSGLTYLDLSHNKLTTVPVNLSDSLEKLYLTGNPIQKLDFNANSALN